MKTWPPTVAPSTRAATLTALPTTAYLARCSEPILPTTASPVLRPMPISNRGRPAAACSRLMSAIARCMASAQAAARSAWSAWASGAPNTANTASPMNSLTVPPWRMTMSVIRARYSFSTSMTRAGSPCSAKRV